MNCPGECRHGVPGSWANRTRKPSNNAYRESCAASEYKPMQLVAVTWKAAGPASLLAEPATPKSRGRVEGAAATTAEPHSHGYEGRRDV